MDLNFLNGIVGGGTRLLGKKIDGLTLWHLLLLEAVENPVISGEHIEPEDLILFQKIVLCSYPNTPNLQPTWRDKFWRLKLFSVKVAEREAKRLAEWLSVQMALPKFYKVLDSQQIREGSNMSAPPLLLAVAALSLKTNETLKDVWNMRYAESRWIESSIAELEGSELRFDIKTDEETQGRPMTEEEANALALKELPPELAKKFINSKNKKINGIS